MPPTEPVKIEPGLYKKTLKLLKAGGKTPKLLEGLKACYDPDFLLQGGALAPMMNSIHGKKVAGEVFREAACVIAEFVDPPIVAPDPVAPFSDHGLRLINKKSSSFKGITRLYELLSHDDPKTVAMTLRAFYGIVRSFVEHGINTGEETQYRAKLKEVDQLLMGVSNAVIASKEFVEDDIEGERPSKECAIRYGFRALHQLLLCGLGSKEVHVLFDFVPDLIIGLRQAVAQVDQDGGDIPADAPGEESLLVSPAEGISSELSLLSTIAWSGEGQVRIAEMGGLECLIAVLDNIRAALDKGEDFNSPHYQIVLKNLSWALNTVVRVLRTCFNSKDERLSYLFEAQNNGDVNDDSNSGLIGAGKTPFRSVMGSMGKSISAIWSILSERGANCPETITILRVMGILATESVEYSEDIRVVFCSNNCLKTLFASFENDVLAASAEKVITALSAHSSGDRKGSFDGRIFGTTPSAEEGDEPVSWLSPSMVVDTLTSAMLDPAKPSLVSRITRFLSKITEHKDNCAALTSVQGETILVSPLLQLVQKRQQGYIAPILDQQLEEASLAQSSISEPATEASSTKKKGKTKSSKPKKPTSEQLEKERLKMVDIGVAATVTQMESRGGMVGAEISVYAMRTLGNLCQFDISSAMALGSTDIGASVVETLFQIGTTKFGNGLAIIYDPLNSRWHEDILSQVEAVKKHRLKHLAKIAEESDGAVDIEAATSPILPATLGEKHSTVYVQNEAMSVLSKFAHSDVTWRENAIALARVELAEAGASEYAIKKAAEQMNEASVGNPVCEILRGHLQTIFSILERTNKNLANAESETNNLVTMNACSILSGLFRAKGGRRSILDSLGYNEPVSPAADSESGEKSAKPSFVVNPDDSSAQRKLLAGVMSILRGESPEGCNAVTLRQRLSAIRLLSAMCRDPEIDDAKQSLEADMISQAALQEGALVQMIALLSPMRAMKDGESYAAGFYELMKGELSELVFYLINRGNCREEYYVKPGEEPRVMKTNSEGEPEPELAAAKKTSSSRGGSRPNSSKSRPSSGKEKKGAKGAKKGAKKAEVQLEQAPAEEIIGVDPNAGPNKEQWATFLNSTANIVEYEYNSRTPLHAAVVGEHFPQIGLLLAAGADANISDAQQITPLHSAIAQGLDKVVNDLVFIGKSAIDAVTEWGDSILKYAFVSPSSRKLRSLLRFHFEEHAHEAMESVSGNARFVTLFLENGADVTSCDADGNYPMHWIINGTSISYRLDGVDVILSNKSGMFGPDCNYLERAQQLLDNGFVDRVDGCNKFGQTPLHLAFARGMTDVAKLLLDNNANPNIIDDRGNIPLHVACVGWALNSEELVRKMLLIGNAKRLIKGTFTSADVARGLTKKAREDHDIENYVNTSYDSIVVAPPAVISRQIPKEKLILLPNKLGYSAIHYACGAGIAGGGASELVQPLGVALGSCPFEGCEMQKPTDDDEELQKRKAILMNRMAILRCLLENGGDPNTIGKNGMRPLHCVAQSSASWHGDLDEKVAERLIAAGAKLDEVDAQGRAGGGGSRFSPLHYAIQTKQFHLTWFLINRGAAIHAATCNPPLLHLACEYGADLELIGYILSHGEDANMRGHGIYRGHRKYCGTALQLAAANGHENIVFALLSSGGNVDVNAAREHNGRTALHLAAFHGHAGCVKHLLEDGSADSKVCCNNGETPLMSAIRGGSVSCLKVFVEAFGSVCILANGDDAILLAEQLNFQKRTSDVHVGVVEYLLSLLPENKLQGVAHVHECYASRQSIVRFEEAKAAALEAERKSVEMSELRRMVEAIFAKADRAGTGHLNMEALKSLHDEIGAGTNMNEEVYLEISETIGANPDHGWDAEHLFQAYAEGHSFFSLERDHDILFPRQNMEEDPEAQQQLRTESYDESN